MVHSLKPANKTSISRGCASYKSLQIFQASTRWQTIFVKDQANEHSPDLRWLTCSDV